MVMLNEALWELYEGVASAEGIDQIMKLGMNHPMGPLALADLIGLDTVLAILEVLQDGYGDPKYRPCPLLKSYVNAGWLGRKSGKGIYEY
jgi:3-hydroxybutyryl-CoA dehydrogenase